MSVIQVESGIPIPPPPPRGGGRTAKYKWADLAVGESFAVPADRLNSIKVLIHRHNTKPRSRKRFTWRRAEDGRIRVWREK